MQFSTATYTVNENAGTATITVTRTGGSDGASRVNYATSNGTATAGSDYTAASGTLTFAAGETSKTFTMPIINDTAVENAETVTLTLSNPDRRRDARQPGDRDADDQLRRHERPARHRHCQQGVNGYTGTTDVSISTQYAQYTGGNGTTTFNGTQLGVYQTTGTGSYTVESLIRFSNLGIPAGATVSGATLTLQRGHLDRQPDHPRLLPARPVERHARLEQHQLGWLHRGTGQDWATPGALRPGHGRGRRQELRPVRHHRQRRRRRSPSTSIPPSCKAGSTTPSPTRASCW